MVGGWVGCFFVGGVFGSKMKRCGSWKLGGVFCFVGNRRHIRHIRYVYNIKFIYATQERNGDMVG